MQWSNHISNHIDIERRSVSVVTCSLLEEHSTSELSRIPLKFSALEEFEDMKRKKATALKGEQSTPSGAATKSPARQPSLQERHCPSMSHLLVCSSTPGSD